ncbi:LysR family transcriptional regulator [Streptomyces sp. GS7]|uniref:LysR family transcriptional regulator n=1 Tax=Streptomyces sp. GS7 TaxID=2692234 RepID=UPI00131753E4|nr:LysR family transcriptional regulator [Streptomyces sp. GS7]QHC24970.1 LysR family transcriptional regulator [Streptomyces sp. GS7]
MELRRLQYFAVLAKHLHFGRAAAEIGIAQPGLSQQIKVLERELDARLFDRGGRAVRLTPAGEALAREVPALFNLCDAVRSSVRAAAQGRLGALRVAYTRSGADLNPGELVRRFRGLNPRVDVEAMTGWTTWNLDLLRDHSVDVAFVRGPVREEGVRSLRLGAEELVAVVPQGHRLSEGDSLRADDLADEPVVLWPRHQGTAFYDEIVRQVWPHRAPRVMQEEPESEQILAAVAGGAGVSVLGRRRAVKLCPPGAVVRDFTGSRPTVSVSVAWREGDGSPTVRDFVAFCRQAAVEVRPGARAAGPADRSAEPAQGGPG